MPKKTPDEWIFEELLSEDENAISAVVRISQNDSYQPEQRWPEMGQILVIKPERTP